MNVRVESLATPRFEHPPLFPLTKDETPYRKISSVGVKVRKALGKEMLVVEESATQENPMKQPLAHP